MSVYRRASGRWAVLVDEIRPATGKRFRVSLGTFERKRDADAAERAAKIRLERGETLGGALTVQDLYERWIASATSRGLAETTLDGYRRRWGYCAPIARTVANELRPATIARLYDDLRDHGGLRRGAAGGGGPLSPQSVQHVHATLAAMFAWAYRLELVQRNVMKQVQPGHLPRRQVRPYAADDARRLIEAAARTRYGPLVMLGMTTALRRGELAGLRWDDLDLARRTATIRGSVVMIPGLKAYKSTKQDRVETIALSALAVAALDAQRALQVADREAAGDRYRDEGWVFATPLGGMPSPAAIAKNVRKIALGAGLTMGGMHAMRHSVATWLLREGVDVRTVSAVLRHAQTSVTLDIYAHEVEGAQAAAVGELDRILGPRNL